MQFVQARPFLEPVPLFTVCSALHGCKVRGKSHHRHSNIRSDVRYRCEVLVTRAGVPLAMRALPHLPQHFLLHGHT